MNRDDFLDKQYYVSFTAGMNHCYHQHKATEWTRWDRFSKIATAIFATLGAVFAVATSFGAMSGLAPWGIAFSLIAAAGTFGVLFAPFSDWRTEHLGLGQKWVELRKQTDELEYQVFGEPTPEDIRRLSLLHSEMLDLCGKEVSRPDSNRLKLCEAEERVKRGEIASAA